MTYSIDDVMPGDVVTLEKGEEGVPGFARFTCRVVERPIVALFDWRDVEFAPRYVEQVQDLIDYGYRLVHLHRPTDWPTPPKGALMLTDKPEGGVGLAISKGHNQRGTRWSHGGGGWCDLPNPVEALPVPADVLRGLLAAWDDQSGYIQGIWRRADEEHPRTALRAKVAAFIDTTRAEWDRAGIEP